MLSGLASDPSLRVGPASELPGLWGLYQGNPNNQRDCRARYLCLWMLSGISLPWASVSVCQNMSVHVSICQCMSVMSVMSVFLYNYFKNHGYLFQAATSSLSSATVSSQTRPGPPSCRWWPCTGKPSGASPRPTFPNADVWLLLTKEFPVIFCIHYNDNM